MKGEKRKGIQEYDFEEYREKRMLLVEERKETKKKNGLNIHGVHMYNPSSGVRRREIRARKRNERRHENVKEEIQGGILLCHEKYH